MKVMPIRYAGDVRASTAFYRALGLEVEAVSRPGQWVELAGRSGAVAIHAAGIGAGEGSAARTAAGEGSAAGTAAGEGSAAGEGGAGRCELCFEADEPLEAVAERLRAAGVGGAVIVDEAFGRSLRVTDPDGVAVQVNEQDRELYT